jgi:hypothetical protein
VWASGGELGGGGWTEANLLVAYAA